MTEPGPVPFARLARWIGPSAVLAVLGGVLFTGYRSGLPAAVLWLGFAMLSGAVLLFWEALRAATGQGNVAGVDEGDGVDPRLERKRTALKALKDLEFEHSLGSITDDDYEAMVARYRAEVREALQELDDALSPYKAEAERLFDETATETASKPAEAEAAPVEPVVVSKDTAPARVVCAACATENEGDAVFCKKCGARVAAEVSEAKA